ncbi:MAG: DUF5668 domain-containing protein [Patescibacteria group bacterium]
MWFGLILVVVGVVLLLQNLGIITAQARGIIWPLIIIAIGISILLKRGRKEA